MIEQSQIENNTEALSLEERKESVLKEVRLELSIAKKEVIEGLSNGSEFEKKELDALKDEILGQQESKVDALKGLTPIEKEQLKQEVEKLFQEMMQAAETIGYQASKLGTIRVFLETKLDDIEDPNSWGNWGKKKLASVKNFFGVSEEKEAMDKEKAFITRFLENDIENVAERVMNGEKLEDILSNEADLKTLLIQNDINLKVPSSRAELLSEKVRLVTHLRKNSQYEAAQEEMENALAKHFENARADFEKNNPAEVAKIEQKAEQRVEEMMKEKSSHTSWVNPQKKLKDMGAKPMTESEMKESREDLINAEKRKMMNKEAGKLIKENEGNIDFTTEEQVIWGMYDDMLDPGDSLWNVSDATQDQILEELVINAPLIIVSGGVASLARVGITAGARAIAGRMAVKWAGKTFARKAAFWTAGMVVEGAAFEASHIALGKITGLNKEDLSAISGLEWAERIFWSSVTLGAFHGTGKGVRRMFQKEVTSGGGKVMSKTSLTKGIEKLTHPGLQKTMLKLVQGGTAVNLEAATMLLTGAAQHGYYSGDWEEYMEDFGEHVGHAFISVLALKTSGKIIHPVMKPMMKLNQKLATSGETNAPSQKLTPEQIRKSTLSQADRQKEASVFLLAKKFRTKPLTEAQGIILQKAHEYSEGGSMGKYSFGELKVKMEILTKDGVFTSKEAKALMSMEGSFAGEVSSNDLSEKVSENTKKITKTATEASNNTQAADLLRTFDFSNIHPDFQAKIDMMLKNIDANGGKIPAEILKNFSHEILSRMRGSQSKKFADIFYDVESKKNADGFFIKSLESFPGHDPHKKLDHLIRTNPTEALNLYLRHFNELKTQEVVDSWDGFAFNFTNGKFESKQMERVVDQVDDATKSIEKAPLENKGKIREAATEASNNTQTVELLRTFDFSNIHPDFLAKIDMMLKNIDANGGKIPAEIFKDFSHEILRKIDGSTKIREYFKENVSESININKPEQAVQFYLSHLDNMVKQNVVDSWDGFAFYFTDGVFEFRTLARSA